MSKTVYDPVPVEQPMVALPVEPGSVVRFEGCFAVWQLFKSGYWQNTSSGRTEPFASEMLLAVYGAKFDVLEVTK